jgi:hypothetical protein
MSEYVKQRAKAAEWMYKRKDLPVEWWRWQVLTHHNSDKETLGLDEKTAFLIFADLVQDGLLVPIVGSDGHEAYAINPSKDDDWHRVMSPARYWFKYRTVQLLLWLLSNIVSAGIAFCLGLWWDKIIGK